jgi:hypothetical protein
MGMDSSGSAGVYLSRGHGLVSQYSSVKGLSVTVNAPINSQRLAKKSKCFGHKHFLRRTLLDCILIEGNLRHNVNEVSSKSGNTPERNMRCQTYEVCQLRGSCCRRLGLLLESR